MSLALRLTIIALIGYSSLPVNAETLRQAVTLQTQLEATDATLLVKEAMRRGDPHRGAIAFHRSAAACIA